MMPLVGSSASTINCARKKGLLAHLGFENPKLGCKILGSVEARIFTEVDRQLRSNTGQQGKF